MPGQVKSSTSTCQSPVNEVLQALDYYTFSQTLQYRNIVVTLLLLLYLFILMLFFSIFLLLLSLSFLSPCNAVLFHFFLLIFSKPLLSSFTSYIFPNMFPFTSQCFSVLPPVLCFLLPFPFLALLTLHNLLSFSFLLISSPLLENQFLPWAWSTPPFNIIHTHTYTQAHTFGRQIRI